MQMKLLCILMHAHAEYNKIIAKKVALLVSLSSSEIFFIDVFNHFLHTIYIWLKTRQQGPINMETKE